MSDEAAAAIATPRLVLRPPRTADAPRLAALTNHAGIARRLATMPYVSRAGLTPAAAPLIDAGILGPRDLPLRILPKRRLTLDGWRFA